MIHVITVGIFLVLVIYIHIYQGSISNELDFITWEVPSVTR